MREPTKSELFVKTTLDDIREKFTQQENPSAHPLMVGAVFNYSATGHEEPTSVITTSGHYVSIFGAVPISKEGKVFIVVSHDIFEEVADHMKEFKFLLEWLVSMAALYQSDFVDEGLELTSYRELTDLFANALKRIVETGMVSQEEFGNSGEKVIDAVTNSMVVASSRPELGNFQLPVRVAVEDLNDHLTIRTRDEIEHFFTGE